LIDWPSYNRSLVRRGEILFSYDFLDNWGSELEGMNKNKRGKPFIFPDSFILVIGYIRYSFHLPYRQTEGIIKATGKNLPEKSPSYGHICKRINKLNVNINNDGVNNAAAAAAAEYIIIAADSTGIKFTNRGQWMREKWHVNSKKGYLKIHVAVDIKTKEILALEVTDEKVHDGKVIKQLIQQVLNNNHNVKIKSFIGDGAYDSNENFKYFKEKRIQPIIKVKRNSIISFKNSNVRNREVQLQTKDYQKWKKKRKYGQRWMTETAFSSIKRMFGEYTSATKFQNMVKEMTIKISLYNLFRRMA
jgi:DDE family transposase